MSRLNLQSLDNYSAYFRPRHSDLYVENKIYFPLKSNRSKPELNVLAARIKSVFELE